MAGLRLKIDAAREEKSRLAPRFAPAGQSTQVIIGADATSDATIIGNSAALYAGYRLKRVYYSAFSPIPDASSKLPPTAPPLQREHRLYEADWLMRYYGFSADEVTAGKPGGMLDLTMDVILAWALSNREWFPIDVNKADRELLLRIPGLGVKSVNRILASRRHRTLRLDDLDRLAVSIRKIRPFVIAADYRPLRLADRGELAAGLAGSSGQLNLFA